MQSQTKCSVKCYCIKLRIAWLLAKHYSEEKKVQPHLPAFASCLVLLSVFLCLHVLTYSLQIPVLSFLAPTCYGAASRYANKCGRHCECTSESVTASGMADCRDDGGEGGLRRAESRPVAEMSCCILLYPAAQCLYSLLTILFIIYYI